MSDELPKSKHMVAITLYNWQWEQNAAEAKAFSDIQKRPRSEDANLSELLQTLFKVQRKIK
jgi:hypothetical protein